MAESLFELEQVLLSQKVAFSIPFSISLLFCGNDFGYHNSPVQDPVEGLAAKKLEAFCTRTLQRTINVCALALCVSDLFGWFFFFRKH